MKVFLTMLASCGLCLPAADAGGGLLNINLGSPVVAVRAPFVSVRSLRSCGFRQRVVVQEVVQKQIVQPVVVEQQVVKQVQVVQPAVSIETIRVPVASYAVGYASSYGYDNERLNRLEQKVESLDIKIERQYSAINQKLERLVAPMNGGTPEGALPQKAQPPK